MYHTHPDVPCPVCKGIGHRKETHVGWTRTWIVSCEFCQGRRRMSYYRSHTIKQSEAYRCLKKKNLI